MSRERRAGAAREADPVGDSGDPGADEEGGVKIGNAKGVAAVCHLYGRTLSYTNMARHQRTCML